MRFSEVNSPLSLFLIFRLRKQDRILDLQKEYGNTPEKAEDAPLDGLGAAMQTGFRMVGGRLASQVESQV